MTVSVFDPNADQETFQSVTRSEPPTKVYSIMFTPRSGSSWLTSVLSKTGVMGTPGEWFNPELMRSSSRAKGARNLSQFIEAISRHESHGNIFGFEITYHQLMAVFESEAKFMSRFHDAAFFWLTREDIVAQGVSLDKMVQTKVSHSANSDQQEIEISDLSYRYDRARIQKWIQHIHSAEKGTEKMIETFGLSAIRLTYEQIIAAGAQNVVGLFARRLGLRDALPELVLTEHQKIGTQKNDEFAKRFRAESKRFIDGIDAQRAKILSRHDLSAIARTY